MIVDFCETPNLVSCQYIDLEIRKRLDKIIGIWFRRNPVLAKEHDRALHLAQCEFDQYEEWLSQQDRIDPATYLFDEDVPW